MGDSEFFPVDAPTEVLWESIDSVPADIAWVYEDFGTARKNTADSNFPEPVQEVVDEAVNVAEEETKEEVNSKVRRGLRSLFGH
jgi:hypothetical protein